MEILISQHLSDCDGSDRRRDLIPVLSRGITVTSLTVSARGYDIIPESARPAPNRHSIPQLLWKILYLPVPLVADGLLRIPHLLLHVPGARATQGEGHISGDPHATHFTWRLGRRWCVSACASDFRRWQRCREVTFFSQSWSSHQALSGLSRAVTP